MGIIIRLLVTAAVAFGLTYILSGVHINSFGAAIVFAIVLGILNLIVKPILKLLGLPLTIITLGLFSLVINAAVVYLADYFTDYLFLKISHAFSSSICTSIVSFIAY